MPRIITLAFLTLVFGLGVVIGFYNTQTVVFDYLLGSVQLPLIALIAGEFIAVVLLTLLVASARILALKAETLRLRKSLNSAESELKNLRNLPVGPDA